MEQLELEKLYTKINQLNEEAEELIESAKGEITPEAEEIYAKIENLIETSLEEADKIYYIKLSIENEMQKFIDLRSSLDNKIEQLDKRLNNIKYLIAKTMKFNNLEKLEGGLCLIKYRVKESIFIFDKDLVPQEFKKERVIVEFDKTKIKEQLKQGKVNGANLVVEDTVTFYKRGGK